MFEKLEPNVLESNAAFTERTESNGRGNDAKHEASTEETPAVSTPDPIADIRAAFIFLPLDDYPALFRDFREAANSGDIGRVLDALSDWTAAAQRYAADRKAGIPVDYGDMLTDLQELETDDSPYDADNLKPTETAFRQARELLQAVTLLLPAPLPPGTIYPDTIGGLRVEWNHPNRVLALAVRSDSSRRNYIFHTEGEDYGGDYEVTPERLKYWLEWLNEDDTKFTWE